MRWRPTIYICLAVLFFAAIGFLERPTLTRNSPVSIARLPSTPASPVFMPSSGRAAGVATRFQYRITNTAEPLDRLARRETALLLENALLDTARPLQLSLPEALRSQDDPAAYLVQSKGPLTESFRERLKAAGGQVVAYVPNNAYIVRASAPAARTLAALPQTQAVLPFEPYYKLKWPLLAWATPENRAGEPLGPAPDVLSLNILLFPGANEDALASKSTLGVEHLATEPSPFGSVLKVRAPTIALPGLAALPAVQEIELSRARVSANDLSRVVTGVSADSVTPSNYLDLTGSNILVAVNDTGVDATHPDLVARVFFDVPSSGTDSNGHGTHVGAVIAGSGAQSLSVTNAPGSVLPPVNGQFRGKAPGARLFSVGLTSVPRVSDTYVQQKEAQTNAFISNNSWLYAGANDYDLAAASYDAAVRDALPAVSGPQPLLFVFAAGNAGQGNDSGLGGLPGSVESPATAKNVLTVGALEQFRLITNQTWSCNGATDCLTNTPWLGLTDSSNQVAAFSSRGNIGVGIEGEYGRFKPDLVAPGTFLISAKSSQFDQQAYYSQLSNTLTQHPDSNCVQVLSNLNDSLGPYYRFESGTSLAAADVSGTLALMREFFAERLLQDTSPALLKALLINGARPLGGPYAIGARAVTNFQGWGLVRLPNSLPAALTNQGSSTSPMVWYDQAATNALSTGQSKTRYVSLSTAAQAQPWRVTLAWTDPPGNPLAGLKLVNDLDLVVTNLDTGDVYLGNDIPPGSVFNQVWEPGTDSRFDLQNNVENVFLSPPLGAHYSVTVSAHHVNVNAVTARTNDVFQDYALVIASGDGQITDALTATEEPITTGFSFPVTFVTNAFDPASSDYGALLVRQRVGANPPVPESAPIPLPGFPNASLNPGSTNQWYFYVVTNDTPYTNAAFFTFLPTYLANAQTGAPPSLGEPDLDLYVSLDPGLTNLDPVALSSADMSLGRGGSELLVYSNASPGTYYIGVKCESARAAEYGFGALFSDLPFAEDTTEGNQLLRGIPIPAPVPAGTPDGPGAALIVCLAPESFLVHRVIVTNALDQSSPGDIKSVLSHGAVSVVLNNHSTNAPSAGDMYIYDDSREHDIFGSQPADGPGSLLDFAGKTGSGVWFLSLLNTNKPATNETLWLLLERQPDLASGPADLILPGATRQDFVTVSDDVTNLTADFTLASGSGPLQVQLCPVSETASNCVSVPMHGSGATARIVVDATSHPPLRTGVYAVLVTNLGDDEATVNVLTSTISDPSPPEPFRFTSRVRQPVPDDAVSAYAITVTNSDLISSVEVGVRIDHPRVSDLVLRLVSPSGDSVLLDENRGAASANLGADNLVTNITPVSSAGGPEASTNIMDTGETSGMITINYDFYSLPDSMHVYYEGNLLFDSGMVSGSGSTNLTYGPGLSTELAIVMNEGGNSDSNTAWFYTVTSTRLAPVYLTFTEDTNLAQIPIKFASPPLTNVTFSGPPAGIFYLPEESLGKLTGKNARGQWTLEVSDTRKGAASPAPTLISWQLAFKFQNALPKPIPLTGGAPSTNWLGPGQVQWFSVDVPEWVSFATNSLLSASIPINLLFNQAAPPTGTNAGDFILGTGVVGLTAVLQTNGSPPLLPAARYYLGVQNANAVTAALTLSVDFDIRGVVTLQSGVPVLNTNLGPLHAADYYHFVVTPAAARVQFEINGPSADLTLVARKGLPLPSLDRYDLLSANPGTNDELLVLYDFSQPFPLTPGDWYLAAINASGAAAVYSILATEFSVNGTNIVLSYPVVTTDSLCVTWTSLPGVHYRVQGKASLDDPDWTTLGPTVTATDVIASFCLPLPSPIHYLRVEEGLVLLPPTLLISQILWSPAGISLNWTAPAQSRFHVEWSTGSTSPLEWNAFTNTVTSSDGSFSFFDDGSQTHGFDPIRFYRLLLLP